MGIKGLTPFLKTFAPNCMQKITKDDLRGKVIAFDISMVIYKYLTTSGNKSTYQTLYFKNNNNQNNDLIWGLFSMTIDLLKKQIKPIFVFDGYSSKLKQYELNKRKERKQQDLIKLEYFKEMENNKKVEKLEKRIVSINQNHIKDCKHLLTLMDVPYIVARSEAEAECSNLVKEKIADFAATEDMDIVTFGCPQVIRNLIVVRGSYKYFFKISLNVLLNSLDLKMDSFIDLCILFGCDFCGTIKGIGVKKGFQLIKEYSSIENILQSKKINQNSIERNWNYNEVRDLFKFPQIHQSYDKELLKWNNSIDFYNLFNFLCNEHQFNSQKVQNIISSFQS